MTYVGKNNTSSINDDTESLRAAMTATVAKTDKKGETTTTIITLNEQNVTSKR
jgi:hypothetical protein